MDDFENCDVQIKKSEDNSIKHNSTHFYLESNRAVILIAWLLFVIL